MATFTVIDHTELTGTTTAWAEDSIPSSYDHLLLMASIRGTQSAYWNNLWIRVGNGGLDTGSNYSYTNLTTVNQSSPISSRATGQTKWAGQYINAASTGSDIFGITEIWIPNYANTTGFKEAIIKTYACDTTTSTSRTSLTMVGATWESTSAITDFQLSEPNSGMAQYSEFTLYGVKGV
jgi:hypothetical protein